MLSQMGGRGRTVDRPVSTVAGARRGYRGAGAGEAGADLGREDRRATWSPNGGFPRNRERGRVRGERRSGRGRTPGVVSVPRSWMMLAA